MPDGESVTLSDILYSSSSATGVPFTVNTPPEAADDTYATDEDAPLTVDAASGVVSNDTDADSDTLTVAQVVTDPATPALGTLSLSADGSFVYTPLPDTAGVFRGDRHGTRPEAASAQTAGIRLVHTQDRPG